MRSITLPERSDRAAAETMFPEMAEAVAAGSLTIDGTQVEQIGLAMLQLLVSARRSDDATIILASDAMRETARITGLQQTLFGGAVS